MRTTNRSFSISFIAGRIFILGLLITLMAGSGMVSDTWAQRRISPTTDNEPRPRGAAEAEVEDEEAEAISDSEGDISEIEEALDKAEARARDREPKPIPEPGIDGGVGKTVYWFEIDTDAIDQDMIDRRWHFKLHRALMAAEAAEADAFVIDLNTNGGRLDVAFMIQARLLDTEIPTITYINSRALSAGAMIALATDNIVMRSTAKTGDALPVIPSGDSETGMKTAEPKVISALAAEMRAAAQAKGHPEAVAVAMVDPNKPLKGFSKKGELLTLTAEEAVDAALIEFIADSEDEVLRAFDLEGANVIRPELTNIERVAAFFSSQIVVGLLGMFALGLLALEFKTPGVGIPAALAIACFTLIFLGSHIANLSGIIEPLLLIVGIALIALEIFVIPGFGIPGIVGIVCVLASIGLSVTEIPNLNMATLKYMISSGIYTVAGSIVGVCVTLPLFLKLLPHIPYLNQAILDPQREDAIRGGSGIEAATTYYPNLESGMVGEAATDLRPAGTAVIEGERYDVVADSRWVEVGTPLQIKSIDGTRILVTPRDAA